MVCKADCLTEALSCDSVRPVSVCLDTDRGGFCGLCMMERQDNVIKGSIFNEFGITAFNFDYDTNNNKVKLYDVIPFLNRWYIKMIIKGDLSCLFSNVLLGRKSGLKGRKLDMSDDSVILSNLKHHIVYTFSNIGTNETIE